MLLGKQVKEKIHLIEQENGETWVTLCGRTARALPNQPMVNFAGEKCCAYCAKVQRSSELLRSRLGVA
jgi:hypothetical protein